MLSSASPWLREHFHNVEQERLPHNLSAICLGKCSTADDGICDDGGPDSVFADCAYGTDCPVRSPEHPIPYTRGLLLIHARPCTHPAQDCCPRDPFWRWDDRYTGTLDAGLTRMVCMQETIIINATSPCLNDIEYSIESKVGDTDLEQMHMTWLVMVLLMLLCVAVFFILVPVAVYAQLVYSGLWPVLNWRQRIWCMLNGNFEAMDQVKQVREKRDDDLRREKRKGRCHRWFHMTHTIQRAEGLYRLLVQVDRRPLHPVEVAAAEEEAGPDSAAAAEAGPDSAAAERVRAARAACSRRAPQSQPNETNSPTEETEQLRCCSKFRNRCMLRTFLFCPLWLIVLAFRLATWDVIFDIIPLSWDGRWARAFVKLLRLVTASFVLALLLTHIPKQNAAAVKETLRCVLESCQHNSWRTTATALGCKAADAVGVTQPTF